MVAEPPPSPLSHDGRDVASEMGKYLGVADIHSLPHSSGFSTSQSHRCLATASIAFSRPSARITWAATTGLDLGLLWLSKPRRRRRPCPIPFLIIFPF
ncbi:hypothetical protein AAHA92_32953 [Salvia divinorum]|uniref:Uncharacterized protein n=1 Tax=Salvia divinorum TaxID=28513 RepID=A0ABD1FQG9_SALDI